MIDTNQVQQAGQVATEIKTQLSPWVPMIVTGLLWLRAEIKKIVDFILGHGGIGLLFWRLIWNPDQSAALSRDAATEPEKSSIANR